MWDIKPIALLWLGLYISVLLQLLVFTVGISMELSGIGLSTIRPMLWLSREPVRK